MICVNEGSVGIQGQEVQELSSQHIFPKKKKSVHHLEKSHQVAEAWESMVGWGLGVDYALLWKISETNGHVNDANALSIG